MSKRPARPTRSFFLQSCIAVAILFLQTDGIAADATLQVVPAKWLNSGNENTPLSYSSRPDLPKPDLLAMFENDAVSDIGYAVATEFARNDTAVFTLFDSGKMVKYDFAAKRIRWDIETSDRARHFALSPDGGKIVVTERDGFVILAASDGSAEKRLQGICNGPCMAVAISGDNRFVIMGDAAGYVHVVEASVPTNHWRRKSHEWPIRKLLFIANEGRRFLVSSDGIEISLFDLNADEERRRITSRYEHDGFRDFWINSLTSVTGTNFFVVGGYSDVFIVDAAPGEIVATYTEAGQIVVGAWASPDLRQVKAVSRDHLIYSWSTETGAVESEHYMETPLLSVFTHAAISADGAYTALTSTDLIFALPPRAPNRIRIFRTP